MKNHLRVEKLLDGYFAGTLSDTELKEFLLLINKEEHFLKSIIDEWLQRESFIGLADTEKGEMIFRQIIEKKDSLGYPTVEEAKVIGISKYGWKRLLVAAGIFGLLLCGAWLMLSQHQHKPNQVVVEATIRDVAPGSNKAILTLADGKQIILDSAQGNIVQRGNLKVTNLGGKLDYEGQSNTVEYHTLSTPRGGQYKLVLPDGSDVWLNAASSITFPTAFIGKERNVTIKGEAYFEVAHNAKQPFHVKVNKMNIEVLGTHFNINSYRDEPYIKTTLLEGSVKISRNDGETVLLKPRHQARVNQLTDEPIAITTPDIDEVMAWKNGRFFYNNTDLKTIMRQVMRWYDVDVEYKNNIPVRYFTADISRDKKLSAILKILELSNIHFRLEEDSSPGHAGKITVLP
jgi:ferric-dicitrate binding protein FerR (iron transport regulator)